MKVKIKNLDFRGQVGVSQDSCRFLGNIRHRPIGAEEEGEALATEIVQPATLPLPPNPPPYPQSTSIPKPRF